MISDIEQLLPASLSLRVAKVVSDWMSLVMSSMGLLPLAMPIRLIALVQLAPASKGYGDSPRPYRVSRLHVTENVLRQHLLEKVEPEYPREAAATRLEGDVIFRIVIGKNGEGRESHLRRGKLNAVACPHSDKAFSALPG